MKLTDQDFVRLANFIGERYGINLEAKRTLIEARLSFYIEQRGYADFNAYVNQVTQSSNMEECQRMMNRVSTSYSYFFREADCILHMTTHALPEFRAAGLSCLSVWSAACAGGQEPYSMAMALQYASDFLGYPSRYTILGTDINTEVLAQAERGVYGNTELDNIPGKYRCFTKPYNEGRFQICDKIRACTQWDRENLLTKTANSPQHDLIFCRNVLIYFKAAIRKKMTGILFDSLKYGGYLYTGATEAVDLERRYFKYVAPSIYKKEFLQ